MKTKEVLKKIAKEKGMTLKQVKDEIRFSIREAMETKDPQAQALWKQIAPDGKEPSVEKFLEYCVERLREERGC